MTTLKAAQIGSMRGETLADASPVEANVPKFQYVCV